MSTSRARPVLSAGMPAAVVTAALLAAVLDVARLLPLVLLRHLHQGLADSSVHVPSPPSPWRSVQSVLDEMAAVLADSGRSMRELATDTKEQQRDWWRARYVAAGLMRAGLYAAVVLVALARRVQEATSDSLQTHLPPTQPINLPTYLPASAGWPWRTAWPRWSSTWTRPGWGPGGAPPAPCCCRPVRLMIMRRSPAQLPRSHDSRSDLRAVAACAHPLHTPQVPAAWRACGGRRCQQPGRPGSCAAPGRAAGGSRPPRRATAGGCAGPRDRCAGAARGQRRHVPW